MNTRLNRRFFLRALWLVLLAGTTACATSVRVPLAVPLPSVGGARPATPQGLQLVGEFGDGVWGQEQERAEMAGGGLGFAIRDHVELSVVGYSSTREVTDSNGERRTGEPTTGVRAKVRFGDFPGDRVSIGVHVAYMGSTREDSDAQNDRLTSWDVALPVEFYPGGDGFVDYRWGVYAGPRLLSQTFEDRLLGVTTQGTLAAALLGVVGRWRHFSAAGELNIAHATPMIFGGAQAQGGWILLPMLGISLILPIGG